MFIPRRTCRRIVHQSPSRQVTERRRWSIRRARRDDHRNGSGVPGPNPCRRWRHSRGRVIQIAPAFTAARVTIGVSLSGNSRRRAELGIGLGGQSGGGGTPAARSSRSQSSDVFDQFWRDGLHDQANPFQMRMPITQFFSRRLPQSSCFVTAAADYVGGLPNPIARFTFTCGKSRRRFYRVSGTTVAETALLLRAPERFYLTVNQQTNANGRQFLLDLTVDRGRSLHD